MTAAVQHVDTVGDALPREIARVRDVVLPPYREIGVSGAIAVAMMTRDLDFAARVSVEGDAAGMIAALEKLRTWHL